MQSKNFYFTKHSKIILFLFGFLFLSQAQAAGGGSDNSTNNVTKSSYYYEALKLIKNKSYEPAIDSLLSAEKMSKNDPDIYNYLGYSFRKINKLDKAAFYYDKALSLSPKHKGALEYQGEMFLTLGQLEKAEDNLKKLEKICFLGCEEEKMLKESISKYKQGKKSNY